MTVTITSDTFLPPRDRFYLVESDLGGTPTFYWYDDGILAETTTRAWRQVTVEPDEQLQVEVLDDQNAAPAPAHPGRLTMTWYADTALPATSYRIDEYVDSEWTAVQTVIPQLGQAYFRSLTRFLEDQTTHQFRVVPIADNGEEGTPLNFTVAMVRRPDPPTGTPAYSAVTGKLSVAAAV